jgi:hypothetical protein
MEPLSGPEAHRHDHENMPFSSCRGSLCLAFLTNRRPCCKLKLPVCVVTATLLLSPLSAPLTSNVMKGTREEKQSNKLSSWTGTRWSLTRKQHYLSGFEAYYTRNSHLRYAPASISQPLHHHPPPRSARPSEPPWCPPPPRARGRILAARLVGDFGSFSAQQPSPQVAVPPRLSFPA